MDAELFERFRDAVVSVRDIHDPRLTIDIDGSVRIQYSVFDHINASARLIVMGITPGELQANEALRTARAALSMKLSASEAMKRAKTAASFAGAMRRNLVAVLDHIGVAKGLGISSCASLWSQHSDLVHFTSALRYPTFVNGQNYSGSQPKMTVHKLLKDHLLRYTGQELSSLNHALLVPLGPAAVLAATAFADAGMFPKPNILLGVPHPSGANAERVAYFLGRKDRGTLSSKTNATKLDEDRKTALRIVQRYFD
jgi:hypothetical protein